MGQHCYNDTCMERGSRNMLTYKTTLITLIKISKYHTDSHTCGQCQITLARGDVAVTMVRQWVPNQIRKLRVVHAPGMPGTFSPPPRVSDPNMQSDTSVTHVPWSLTSSFLWTHWRRKRSRHSPRMRNPQFFVSGKRLMTETTPT